MSSVEERVVVQHVTEAENLAPCQRTQCLIPPYRLDSALLSGFETETEAFVFVRPRHQQPFQLRVLVVEPFDEYGQGICANVPNGLCQTVIWVTWLPFSIQYLKPDAQSLSLINRLPLTQPQPRHHARQHHQHDGQRDLNPLSHGGSMSRIRQKSSNLRCRSGWAIPATLASAAIALWLCRGLCMFPQRQNQIEAGVVAHHHVQARKPLSPGKRGGDLHGIKIVRHGTIPIPSVWPSIELSRLPVPQEHLHHR
jgi:hypothetical protein